MEPLSKYLDEKHPFEEKIATLLATSKKIVENSNNGIQNGGCVLVMVDRNHKVEIVSSETEISSSFNKKCPETIYRNTVEDIIKTLNGQDIRELKWRYTDTTQFYESIITQVVEHYIKGKVPIDVDILEIDTSGHLPEERFHEPLELGEKYYNKVAHNSNWTYFIELDNKIEEQKEEKIRLNLEFLSMYLDHFLEYLWKYRMVFKGECSFSHLMVLSERHSLIHPIVFLHTKRYILRPINYTMDWIIDSVIGSGEYGTVFKFSHKNNNCEYAIKLVKSVCAETPYNTMKEIRIWTQAEILGVGPKLVEYYCHDSKSPENTYFIIVMEKLDVTLEEALNLAEKEGHTDLQELLFLVAGEILIILHRHYIAHGDAHFKNFMLKCEDKAVFQSAQLLYEALLNGMCEMKIIDFGFSTTISYLTHHLTDELRALFPLGKQLFKYGYIKKDKLPNHVEPKFLLDILCSYDISLMECYIKAGNRKILGIISYLREVEKYFRSY
jgi:hypothetical protein